MDYSRPSLADRLAAEYVLGTLQGPARRRFEALLPAHPALRQAKQAWERRLVQLSEATPPVTPSPQVWAGIQKRLFDTAEAQPARNPVAQAAQGMVRWWQRLALWQGAAGVATVAALAFGILLGQPRPVQPPIVIVMAAQPAAGGSGIQPASFVASVSGDGRSLVLKPLHGDQQVALGKALELWAVPAHGAPRSLGLVSQQGATTVLRTSLLVDTAAFAVSVEPPGGSPSGAPTGPIISVGKLQL
jgi:anti-sigma-K factor RskA